MLRETVHGLSIHYKVEHQASNGRELIRVLRFWSIRRQADWMWIE